MAGLRDLRRRIRSIQNTQQITKAMKMVAAARLSRLQEKLGAGRTYFQKLDELITHLQPYLETSRHPLTEVRDEGKILLIVVTADRGLCGAYNLNVLRKALSFYASREKEGIEVMTIGRRGELYLKWRHFPVVKSYTRIPLLLPLPVIYEISNEVMKRFLSRKVREVHLFYTRFVSLAKHLPTGILLLPVRAEVSSSGEGQGVSPAVKSSAEYPTTHRGTASPPPDLEYEFEPPPQVILDNLLPRIVQLKLYRALGESFASEQAARMIAMDNATENAADLIRSLTRTMNVLRQESITKELMDIVGGVEALK